MRSRRRFQIVLSNAFSGLILRLFRNSRSGKNNILYVNSEKLGDLVLCSDFFISQRQNTTYNKYYLVLQEQYFELFDWEKSAITPIPFNKNKYRKDIFYRISFILKIRRLGISKAINITPERGMVDEEIVLASGAENKTALKESSLFLTEKFAVRNNKKYSEIFRSGEKNEYNRLMEYSGKTFYFSDIINIKLSGIDAKNAIVIAPMASEMDRTWGLNNYKELLSALDSEIFLLGTEKEKFLLDSIIPENKNIKNLAGKYSLPEIADIIKNCRLFIGNDSGLTHLALNLGTPLIAIIGGGKHGIFFPYKERKDALFLFKEMDCFGCSWFCKFDEMKCLSDVSVQLVLEQIKLLKQTAV